MTEHAVMQKRHLEAQVESFRARRAREARIEAAYERALASEKKSEERRAERAAAALAALPEAQSEYEHHRELVEQQLQSLSISLAGAVEARRRYEDLWDAAYSGNPTGVPKRVTPLQLGDAARAISTSILAA